MPDTAATNHEFRAEVRKVLNIITNSLYTNREIFLRELVSNASDALDKLRFQQNRGSTPRAPELPLEIRITTDKDGKTLTIADTGIGMTREELVENLGTIARSGSEQFLADLAAESAGKKEGDGTPDASNIIGRFGVGFYAVFMVADKVDVTSRPAFEDAPACTWTSDGLGTFTVTEAQGDAVRRGTTITAHLKEDAAEFLEKYRCESVIRKHSAFIPFPVFVDGDQVNTTPALWREPKFSVTREQYAEFYKFLTYDGKDPLDTLHLSVDAPVQFNALLFIPDTTQDFFGADRDRWGLDLYARRVLIQRENKELLPEYLGFLKGVVDTEDLPLNISR
ncbi:MAG: molecular chaperone HtpG, partial [Desulfovibrionaceae bacterium]|nr:molecular chaperone HtpG [Desulfovibrionaceae bacterium]